MIPALGPGFTRPALEMLLYPSSAPFSLRYLFLCFGL